MIIIDNIIVFQNCEVLAGNDEWHRKRFAKTIGLSSADGFISTYSYNGVRFGADHVITNLKATYQYLIEGVVCDDWPIEIFFHLIYS